MWSRQPETGSGSSSAAAPAARLAEEIGLTSMLITSGREAFWNAISEAKQQAKISQVEREKALSFQTMLDNAYEGWWSSTAINRSPF